MKLHYRAAWALLLLAAHGAAEVLRRAPRMRGAEAEAALGLEGAVPLKSLEQELSNMLKAKLETAANQTEDSNADEAALAEEAEATLERGLSKLRAGKATPEMQGFVSTISKLINDDMKPKILATHKKSEDMLKSLDKAFARCKGAKNSKLGIVKGMRKGITVGKKKHNHCRKIENREGEENGLCVKLMESKESLVKSSCQAEELLRKNPHTEADNCHTTKAAEPYEQWVERNMRWFAEKDKVYDDAKTKCDDAKAQRALEKPKCDKQARKYGDHRKQCNTLQETLEGGVCALAKKVLETCEAYDTCYASAKERLEQQVKLIKKAEKDRKGEWRALMRIACLLDVFADDDGSVDEAVINRCKEKTHATTHLDLEYPKAHAKSKCASMPHVPCSSSYMRTAYHALPKGAQPEQCSPCVLKMDGFGADPLVWLTADGFDAKTGGWKNRGTTGDFSNVVVGGIASLMLSAGHGARGRVLAVWGGTSTVLNFGNIVPKSYTMCSLTRYLGRHKRRILNGRGVNWLHGHWHGKAGVAYFHGWKTQKVKSEPRLDKDWVAMCSKNSGAAPTNVLVNGKAVGRTAGGPAPLGLLINGGVHGKETSEFAIAELMIWDGPLTDFHMSKAMHHLMQRLTTRMTKEEAKKEEARVKQANLVARRRR